MTRTLLILFALSFFTAALSGCGSTQPEARYPTGADRASTGGDIYKKPDSIFGAGGLSIFGGKKDKDEDNGIGVNSYLWRAALDTIAFMPLESADPFGGVIITQWHAAPDAPNERLKLNVLILDKRLSAQGVRVKAFRQVKKGSAWKDAAVAADISTRLEDAILTRARQLRVDAREED